MNFLMLEALKKIAFIPFGYLIDQWRWDLFADEFGRDEYNSRWWNVRYTYVCRPSSYHGTALSCSDPPSITNFISNKN